MRTNHEIKMMTPFTLLLLLLIGLGIETKIPSGFHFIRHRSTCLIPSPGGTISTLAVSCVT